MVGRICESETHSVGGRGRAEGNRYREGVSVTRVLLESAVSILETDRLVPSDYSPDKAKSGRSVECLTRRGSR
jgi:hypothetical protein